MKNIVIGIAGCATTSAAVALEETGKALSFTTGPGLNYRINYDVERDLGRLLSNLAFQLGLSEAATIKATSFIALGMCGVIDESGEAEIRRCLCNIGWGKVPFLIREDSEVAFVGNQQDNAGILVTAGSGSSFVLIKGKNKIRLGGYGPVLSDDGGGFYLGARALRAILLGRDGILVRNRKLEKRILDFIGISSPQQLVDWFDCVRTKSNWRNYIAALAEPVIISRQTDNDKLSKEILDAGLNHLLNGVIRLIRKAKLKKMFLRDMVVILEGGVFAHSKYYRGGFKRRLKTVNATKNLQIRDADFKPVMGACVLACARGSKTMRTERLQTLMRSVQQLTSNSKEWAQIFLALAS